MKKLFLISIAVLALTVVHGQTIEPFTLKGSPAKLIASWTGKKFNTSMGTLTSGDKIQIKPDQVGIGIYVIHNNVKKYLETTEEGDNGNFDNMLIKVYEYDFDNDKQKEIIVVYSVKIASTQIQVFKYSGGLSEKVGNFDGQFDIYLNKNSIYLPFGSQGLGSEYLYINGSFFELVYHDPNQIQD